MIFSRKRDLRLVTVRRGGTLRDADHHRLAAWAADCAEHVLHHFEHARPGDDRPRRAIGLARAWARGEIAMTQARAAAFANAAAREASGAAKLAALAAAQAVAVSHVPAHELGAAAYAIRAARGGPRRGAKVGRSPGVPVAAGAATRRDPRPRAGRPEVAQRGVLVRIRLLTGPRRRDQTASTAASKPRKTRSEPPAPR